MKRIETINLYSRILKLKCASLSRDAQLRYITTRLEMRGVAQEFDKFREEAVSQNDDPGKVEEVVREWLRAESGVDVAVLNMEDALDLIGGNPDITGDVIDSIVEHLVKKEP